MSDNPIVGVKTEWNKSSRAVGGNQDNQVEARYFQVSALQDEVLDCVSWDAVANAAGTQVTYVAKPAAIIASGKAIPDYEVNDIIVGIRLRDRITRTLDDDSTWDCDWIDSNIDARTAGTTENVFFATWAIMKNITPLSGLAVGDIGSLTAGLNVLLVNQDDQSTNGLYTVATTDWTRVVVQQGSLISVIHGSAPYHAGDGGEGEF